MNMLQFAGTIVYTTGLIEILQIMHFEKKGKTVKYIAFLALGTVLSSANAGINLKIMAALSVFASIFILAPFIGKIKK